MFTCVCKPAVLRLLLLVCTPLGSMLACAMTLESDYDNKPCKSPDKIIFSHFQVSEISKPLFLMLVHVRPCSLLL